MLETRRALGGSRVPCHTVIGVLPPDAAFSVPMEEAKGQFYHILSHTIIIAIFSLLLGIRDDKSLIAP